MSLNFPGRRRAYGLDEVAEMLGGISIRSVYTRIDSGDLKAVKIGGRRMVLDEDLEAFIEAAKAKAA